MTMPLARHRTPAIAVEDVMIPSDTAGIALHLRRKRPAGVDAFPAERTVLLMHGATYSSGSLFDAPVGGFSFMDHLAAHGYDVHALDVRGYGGSTRPPEMTAPPEANPPLGRTESGIRDLSSAVDFVLDQRGLSRLNLVAMSWGGSVASAYTSRNNGKVAKLALIAPLWLSPTSLPIDSGGTLGAWRRVLVLETKQRWLGAAPEGRRDSLIPPGWFETWAEATLADEPRDEAWTPGSIRAPNGPILDIREHWAAGRPLYDPGAITVPVLLAHAEWDIDVTLDMTRDTFSRLTAAPYRRWVEIGEGTHMIVLEKNRLQLFDAIRGFLDEDHAPAK